MDFKLALVVGLIYFTGISSSAPTHHGQFCRHHHHHHHYLEPSFEESSDEGDHLEVIGRPQSAHSDENFNYSRGPNDMSNQMKEYMKNITRNYGRNVSQESLNTHLHKVEVPAKTTYRQSNADRTTAIPIRQSTYEVTEIVDDIPNTEFNKVPIINNFALQKPLNNVIAPTNAFVNTNHNVFNKEVKFYNTANKRRNYLSVFNVKNEVTVPDNDKYQTFGVNAITESLFQHTECIKKVNRKINRRKPKPAVHVLLTTPPIWGGLRKQSSIRKGVIVKTKLFSREQSRR